jgi:predicted methyltransferase
MHAEAMQYVAGWAKGRTYRRVLEFGSLNINGTARDVIATYDDESYFGIDVQDGYGVDEVVDAVDYRAALPVELVVCCEVLEHAADVPGIVRSAFENLIPGGVFLVTCATEPREPHSAVDGGPKLREKEHYANVEPETLVTLCRKQGFIVQDTQVHLMRGDLYLRAKRP